ncbi:uncharacterized protein LOC127012050 isoform X4 [Drosophila biarmipes]|uniref:uncharacterized protein LOC127012050 isoform X2 n=1 Tax=Drosophila biarmipes TaxID=125945 RepID=UPI0021CC8ABA|nr:uncharacterized protein LOC127012050 isoform X2 [Drosophila biarmipes]XP_050746185.1 uncharacterized protein LOC127012050 isoform X3 [Drosophila biarmipes]XP_050746186.1 uncharacterized protein LOC127012050 isoform X4 [Drosophila biarmipes]
MFRRTNKEEDVEKEKKETEKIEEEGATPMYTEEVDCQQTTKNKNRKEGNTQVNEEVPKWLRGTTVLAPLRVHLCSQHRPRLANQARPRRSEPTELHRAHIFSTCTALHNFFHCTAMHIVFLSYKN